MEIARGPDGWPWRQRVNQVDGEAAVVSKDGRAAAWRQRGCHLLRDKCEISLGEIVTY